MQHRSPNPTTRSDLTTTYGERGYVAPLDIFTPDEAGRLRAALERDEAAAGGKLPKPQWHKCHLLFDWADEIVHHPAILDVVEQLLGPDLLCWTTNLFTKNAGTNDFVSWHQDAAYWGIDADDVVTAWVALSRSDRSSGCLEVIPGSHRTGLLPQQDTFAKGNLLTRGQTLTAPVGTEAGVPIVLEPGQMSVHHVQIVHGSGPNTSDDRRIGLAIRYIPATARKLGHPESAMPVRGTPIAGHWLPERRPVGRPLAARLAEHNRAVRRQVANNFKPVADSSLPVRARLLGMRLALGAALGVRQVGLDVRARLTGGAR